MKSAKSPGRGRPRIDSAGIMVKMPPAELAALDSWIAGQGGTDLSRPAALRRLAAIGIAAEKGRPPAKRTAKN